mgnify:CR=1 FL=1
MSKPNPIKSLIKKALFNRIPGIGGRYRYCGSTVHFPLRSLCMDLLAEEGIYEHSLLRVIQILMPPNSTFFDIGANIGLMSLPILQRGPEDRVVSFEPSPNSLPWLRKTWEDSPFRNRWTLVGSAVGREPGTARFTLSDPSRAGYDGLRHTARMPSKGEVEVEITTLDREWTRLGRPSVGIIKIDIEGGELDAFAGADQLLEQCRPPIVMEWFSENFQAYGHRHEDLMTFARKYRYQIVTLPEMHELRTLPQLTLASALTGNVALLPE